MGYWLTIELEHGTLAPLPAVMDPENQGFVYGTTVPQLLNQLDRITQGLGVSKIDDFIHKDTKAFSRLLKEAESEGNAVLASAMRAEIATLDAQLRWHEPAVARQTIGSLKEFLASNPQILPGENPQATASWILWDLEAYDRILADVQAQGLKFAFVERNDLN